MKLMRWVSKESTILHVPYHFILGYLFIPQVDFSFALLTIGCTSFTVFVSNNFKNICCIEI